MTGVAIRVAAGSLAAAVLAGYLLRRRFLLVTVEGVSMEPTYRAGDRLLVRRAGLRAVRRDAVVVVRTAAGAAPEDPPLMVKRAAAVPGDPVPAGVPERQQVVPPGRLVVIGDNAAHSADSRKTGFLRATDVVGVVVDRRPRPSWPE